MVQFQCTLADDELGTILAALRFYQQAGLCDSRNLPARFRDIATNLGQFVPLDEQGIDQLCERLNFGSEV